ncbi:MAG: GNAT family N-acetyltransferase [Pseudomonadota bacterium]
MNGLAPPAEISGARLTLRRPRLEDARALFESYTQDPEVAHFLTWQPHGSQEETERFLTYCLDEWQTRASFPYVIELFEAIGPCGMIHLRPKPQRVEFGYVLARAHWGKGYMAEALALLVEWSLAQRDIWRASAFCDVENTASARVMEKAGMVFEGTLRRYSLHPNISPIPRDAHLYAKVRP